MLRGKNLGDAELLRAHVLEFIHHDVLHPLLPLFADVGEVLQYIEGKVDEVIEVHAEALLLLVEEAEEDFLVLVYPRHGPLGLELLVVQLVDVFDVGFRAHLLGLKHLVDLALDGRLLERQLHVGEDAEQDFPPVLLVQYDEVGGEVERVDVLVKKLGAEGVEGADEPQVHVAQLGADAGFHLVGSPVGEGDAEDVLGRDAKVADQVAVSAGQGPRLARACPGDDADGALGRLCGGQLLLVQL